MAPYAVSGINQSLLFKHLYRIAIVVGRWALGVLCGSRLRRMNAIFISMSACPTIRRTYEKTDWGLGLGTPHPHNSHINSRR